MGVGRFVHVVSSPLLEAIGRNIVVFIVAKFAPLKIVAGAHLQEAVDLLAHQIKI